LHSRGLDDKDIWKWKPGFVIGGELNNRVVFPSVNDKGKCGYYVARTIVDDFIPYMNPDVEKSHIIFNELNLNFEKSMVLVEGVFDAIIAGDNSVPILGSTLPEDSKLFRKISEYGTPVYLALDPDAEEKQLKIVEDLLQYDIDCFLIDVEPFKDVGSMTKQEFQERKEQATQMTLDSMLEYKMIQQFKRG
jgi:hypothetical protein